MKLEDNLVLSDQCVEQILAIKDTMELITGKWKILIVVTLLLNGTMRFMELKKALNGIASKKLSKDLQDLEINKLINRKVVKSKPITVEYSITEHGRSLDNLIAELMDWGLNHRKKIIKS
ncbi:winged helix-turn-helix transcriptional regulator [Xanthomarina spongicola]|uniref:HxlR family transcriptional regulator n=1 Tax=Xanthomarina spongicola TaxID=570520 RepID=A0A316DP65_9FLAO|nr:winged helix-turn-helix transcriptional regulator [Xanthomarina spongicola]PWK19814.1 HxlR family transcriptional regulator [Xanthomarina spongicola]